MSITCSTCSTTGEREDCHRNRYGEYICRKCRVAGITFTWHQRLRHLKKMMLPWLLLGLLVLSFLVMWGLALGFLDFLDFLDFRYF